MPKIISCRNQFWAITCIILATIPINAFDGHLVFFRHLHETGSSGITAVVLPPIPFPSQSSARLLPNLELNNIPIPSQIIQNHIVSFVYPADNSAVIASI